MSASDLERLVLWAAAVRFTDLPGPVVERARTILMDDLGAILGGSLEPEATAIRERRLSLAGPGRATVLAPGLPQADPYTAAELNGTAGCWLELDEGYRMAVCHAGIYTLPAVLAMAEERRASGQELLLALTVGYEVAARFARAYRFAPFVLHPHGVFAATAAAAGVAKLLGYGPEQFGSALTSAISLTPATPYRHAIDGALVRNVWTGLGARTGIAAAEYAAFGVSGSPSAPAEVFVNALHADPHESELSTDLGVAYAVTDGYHKQFACCQYAHSALAAVLAIRARHPRCDWASAVAGIRVQTHPAGLSIDNRNPATTLAAKFSMPHAVAACLLLGTGGRRAFTRETLTSEPVRQLRDRVVLERYAPLGPWPQDRPARVFVEFQDGSVDTAECINAPGDPVSPLSAEALRSKFTELVSDTLGDVDVQRVVDVIGSIEQADSVAVLTDALCSRSCGRRASS